MKYNFSWMCKCYWTKHMYKRLCLWRMMLSSSFFFRKISTIVFSFTCLMQFILGIDLLFLYRTSRLLSCYNDYLITYLINTSTKINCKVTESMSNQIFFFLFFCHCMTGSDIVLQGRSILAKKQRAICHGYPIEVSHRCVIKVDNCLEIRVITSVLNQNWLN